MRRKSILPWAMRFFAILQVLTGVGFIIYSVYLESPPKTAIPIGLIIIGVVAILSFFVGFIGSFYKRWCLGVYLIMGTLVTLAELGIVLTLFFNLDGVLDNMSDYQLSKQPEDVQSSVEKGYSEWVWPRESTVKNALEIGRWIFLVVIILQLVGLSIAIAMKTCCYREADEDYEDFEAQQALEAANRAHSESVKAQIQMENLKQSIGRTSKTPGADAGSSSYASSSKLYRNVTKKMASKYGQFSHDGSYQKGWFSRLFGR